MDPRTTTSLANLLNSQSFQELVNDPGHKDKVRASGGEETFESLSEEEQDQQYQLEQLAQILLEIFPEQKCQKTGHEMKASSVFRRNRPTYDFW